VTGWRRRAATAEAATLVTLASLVVQTVGSAPLMRLLGRAHPPEPRGRPPARGTAVRARGLARTVDRVADRLPWAAPCLPRALATRAMLRRRGIPCTLHLGIASTSPLTAHAWVTAGGTVVQGGPIDHVTPLATLR
jgi:hypothetical protein